jgi:O-antigen/teichoic acid export membrane protein
MVMTVPLAVVYLVLPSTINIKKASTENFRRRLIKLFSGFLSLGLVLWLGVMLFRLTWIQNLLGENYQAAINLLIFASPLLLIRTLNQFNRVYLFSVGWERKQLIPQGIAIVLKFGLGILLVIGWDVTGLIWLSIAVDLILLIGFSLPVISHAKQNLRGAT